MVVVGMAVVLGVAVMVAAKVEEAKVAVWKVVGVEQMAVKAVVAVCTQPSERHGAGRRRGLLHRGLHRASPGR